jgi:hypothetical protein
MVSPRVLKLLPTSKLEKNVIRQPTITWCKVDFKYDIRTFRCSRTFTLWYEVGIHVKWSLCRARCDRCQDRPEACSGLLAIGRSWINATLGNRRHSAEGGPAKWNDLGRISLGVPFRATSKHSLSNIAMLVVIGAGFSCGRDILRSCCFEDLLGF